MILSIHNLTKQFGEHRAVDDVSFSIAAFERVALLGPNGAGKTTTLMMAMGVTRSDSGDAFVNGISVTADTPAALRSVGFAAAYMTVPRSITVMESLRISAMMSGLPWKSSVVDEMIERFGVGHLVNRLGGELSSGQKTTVGLARASMGKPKLLVLDEPTAYLDPSMSLSVREQIDSACRDWGASLLITSHNMRDIDHLCDRVVFMSQGKVLYDLAPDALRAAVGTDDLDEAFIDIANEQNAHDAQNENEITKGGEYHVST